MSVFRAEQPSLRSAMISGLVLKLRPSTRTLRSVSSSIPQQAYPTYTHLCKWRRWSWTRGAYTPSTLLTRSPVGIGGLLRLLRQPACGYSSVARLGNLPEVTGLGAVCRRCLACVRKHWRRCATASGLCGGGAVLGVMAVQQGGSSTLHSLETSPGAVPPHNHSYHVADCSSYCEATFSQFTLWEQACVTVRFLYLCLLFSPAIILYGASRLFGSTGLESAAWTYTMRALQIAGPAFVKLGQWASTRRDLFTEEFCNSLSQLHTSCQPHRWKDTVKTLEEEFGERWMEVLTIRDQEPVGSGCIAQVYKGYLHTASIAPGTERAVRGKPPVLSVSNSARIIRGRSAQVRSEELRVEEGEEGRDGGRLIPVAVKVMHPGSVQAMERDMLLMRYVASWSDWLNPDFHWVALKECFSEFATVMRKQLDMELEAWNLKRFQQILGDRDSVRFPTPLFPFVTKRVLVETFEPGRHISNYMDNPGGELQKSLARIGIEVLLDMLFIHNFVHGDLHPGNILVQETRNPRIVLLDCGIATSLTPFDLSQMQKLFTAIIKGEGTRVADLMLGAQHCSTVEEYRRNMAELVMQGRSHLTMGKTQVSNLLSDLFDVLIKHKVRMSPNYTSVFVAIMVIEGLGRSLDPSLDILEAATPCLLHRARKDITARLRGTQET